MKSQTSKVASMVPKRLFMKSQTSRVASMVKKLQSMKLQNIFQWKLQKEKQRFMKFQPLKVVSMAMKELRQRAQSSKVASMQ